MRTVCPACKAELRVIMGAGWRYTILSLSVAIAWAIASAQGHQSVIFAFWLIVYTAIISGTIMVYRFVLRLPMHIEIVPDCRLWPIKEPEASQGASTPGSKTHQPAEK